MSTWSPSGGFSIGFEVGEHTELTPYHPPNDGIHFVEIEKESEDSDIYRMKAVTRGQAGGWNEKSKQVIAAIALRENGEELEGVPDSDIPDVAGWKLTKWKLTRKPTDIGMGDQPLALVLDTLTWQKIDENGQMLQAITFWTWVEVN